MNHDFIAAHDVIARYVADRLAADEARDFEAHFVDCAQCTEDVEQELALREGLGAAAAERTTAPRPVAPVRGWNGSLWLRAAAAVLVAVAARARRLVGPHNVGAERRAVRARGTTAPRRRGGPHRARARAAHCGPRGSGHQAHRRGATACGRASTERALADNGVRADSGARRRRRRDRHVHPRSRTSIAPLVVLTVEVPARRVCRDAERPRRPRGVERRTVPPFIAGRHGRRRRAKRAGRWPIHARSPSPRCRRTGDARRPLPVPDFVAIRPFPPAPEINAALDPTFNSERAILVRRIRRDYGPQTRETHRCG